jgi:hypothetical protein
MSDPVELSVRSSLGKVIDEFEGMRAKADEVAKAFKDVGGVVFTESEKAAKQASGATDEYRKGSDSVAAGLKENTKRATTFFNDLRGLGRRVADQLRGDFKSLVSITALQNALKLTGQFNKSVGETIQLNDTIRKLGRTFGIAAADFASFQAKLTTGLGDIGLASDVAARTLEGLSHTPVRGQENLVAYSRTAGMLASIGGQDEKGKEGDIGAGMARVIQARGGDFNDQKQMTQLAEMLRRVQDQTGSKPSQTLAYLEAIFSKMPDDFRKAISASGLASLAAGAAVGGPNSTEFLKDFLAKDSLQRRAIESQGGTGIVTDQGIDVDKFRAFADKLFSRFNGDKRAGVKTLNLDDDSAEGFIRLYENLTKVKTAEEGIAHMTGNLVEQYYEAMGAMEAFNASVNRLKSTLSGPIAAVTQGVTGGLAEASKTTMGATAVVVGGGVLASLLASGALKGLGGGLFGGMISTVVADKAAEAMLKKETIPVFVVNAAQIGNNLPGAAGLKDVVTTALGVGGMTAAVATAGIVAGGAAALGGGYYAGGKAAEKIVDTEEKHAEAGVIGRVMKDPKLLDDPRIKDIYDNAVRERDEKSRNGGYTNAQMILADPKRDMLGPPSWAAGAGQDMTTRSPGAAGNLPHRIEVKVGIETKRTDLHVTKKSSQGASH